MPKQVKTSNHTKPLNRIVIGDVGSGKTIVAFFIALTFLKSSPKSQVALLAPTEVLAFQHYQNLLDLQASIDQDQLDFEAIFVASHKNQWNGQKITPKKLLKKLPQTQKPLFWLGTHAVLFQEFAKPDMVMIDEQHRFGVRQRQHLSQKNSSHFISFTATPIPRTLAMSLYRGLKPIFLKKLENRNPVKTSISFLENLEAEVIPKIDLEIQKNRKVYVVCPRVEDKEESEDELWSIKKATKFLEKFFPNKILSVHGKIKTKKDILTEFKNSTQKQILVATTVIEVGVDIQEASMVLIFNAERFGLSTLHQIRGRVGRNQLTDNQCILLTYKKFSRVRRLKYLCQTNDGFALSEKDLELRGSGNLLGTEQSGFENEIDSFIGLNPQMYNQIASLIDDLDFLNLDPSKTSLDSLPRLAKFLQTESQKVWEE